MVQIQVISPWWNVTGKWIEQPNDNDSSMVGINVAEALDLDIGDEYIIRYIINYENNSNIKEYNLTVVGIINTEGHEDNQIFVNLQVAQNLTERPNKIHTTQVSAL